MTFSNTKLYAGALLLAACSLPILAESINPPTTPQTAPMHARVALRTPQSADVTMFELHLEFTPAKISLVL